tara:strand:+ start:1190 stop:1363 length:174 start_codon:yes stop_codon:yes gene_type:complete
MNIKSAKYQNNLNGEAVCIHVVVNDVTMFVPIDPDNRHYAEIMRQVDAGTLTIEDAD